MNNVIDTQPNKHSEADQTALGETSFTSLYNASLDKGLSEAEIVARCGRVWMDCSLGQQEFGRDELGYESPIASPWLGRGSICGKRCMPLWGELTKASVSLLVGRLRDANPDLRGLWVHETNALWEEDVKLLSFNAMDLDIELLGSSEKYCPDRPTLYIETEKLDGLVENHSQKVGSSGFTGVNVNTLNHAEVNTLIQHVDFYDVSNSAEHSSKQSQQFSNASGAEETDSKQCESQPLKSSPDTTGNPTPPTEAVSEEQEPIGSDALLKMKATWPMQDLAEAFKAMVRQGWVESAPDNAFLEHFTNSTLKEPVPQQTPKLNWLESKSLLHAVMKVLQITLRGVNQHFLLRGEIMSPINSGLKWTEQRNQMIKARELLREFQP